MGGRRGSPGGERSTTEHEQQRGRVVFVPDPFGEFDHVVDAVGAEVQSASEPTE